MSKAQEQRKQDCSPFGADEIRYPPQRCPESTAGALVEDKLERSIREVQPPRSDWIRVTNKHDILVRIYCQCGVGFTGLT